MNEISISSRPLSQRSTAEKKSRFREPLVELREGGAIALQNHPLCRCEAERDAFTSYGTRNHRERPRASTAQLDDKEWVKFGEPRCSRELPKLRDDEDGCGTP